MERDGFRHGFDPTKWEAGKQEARAIIYETARRRSTISYSDLVAQISSVLLEAYDVRLDHFLGEIAREDDDAGLGLSTVLVVHKSGDLKPGPGFFEMAESQGRDIADPLEFWSEELSSVHDHWASRRKR